MNNPDYPDAFKSDIVSRFMDKHEWNDFCTRYHKAKKRNIASTYEPTRQELKDFDAHLEGALTINDLAERWGIASQSASYRVGRIALYKVRKALAE